MSESRKDDARELKAVEVSMTSAPDLPYQPPVPKDYNPGIALIGCGGIARNHLDAYKQRGYRIVALCDSKPAAAEVLKQEFFPAADVCTNPQAIWERGDVEVVDLATHPGMRLELIRSALKAGKHVLSQKPFVTDIAIGRELVKLADENELKLAVNQNGRWAPYFAYLREVLKAGLLGDIVSCDINITWDHSWIKGTRFEELHHVVLYDFAIHWFDIVTCVFGERRAKHVFSQVEKSLAQEIDPPLLANSIVGYNGGQATLAFRAHTKFDPLESTVVTGTKGVFRSSGPPCSNDKVSLTTEAGRANVSLSGNWFNDGFAGSMGELLCSIEDGREPENSAAANLRSLELCFAAIASADSGSPAIPGNVLSFG
ncbi:Gfo/Idh/MocA family protein [Pelagicoccus mobilis]|uniref:Gfo/Idh/MocA family oxidoreductase n=1 Tax=Pelagicoccus mobilis TaxID=415221 RepID=A0A934RV39_9BACT|nr:Gfo/Idh/MocA family oxidoreductase [Pelagicoccus mobilis]MBK1875985.1 Gfo/Idh/MocA family oxidoreductase [Pelagicoccus mobilis]